MVRAYKSRMACNMLRDRTITMTLDELVADSVERCIEAYALKFHTGEVNDNAFEPVLENMKEAMLKYNVTVAEFQTYMVSNMSAQIVMLVDEIDRATT